MASGDVFRVRFSWLWGTVECQPGFHLVEGAGGAGPDPVLACANRVADVLGATPIPGFSDQSDIKALIVEDIQPGTGPTLTLPLSVAPGDEVDVNPLPPQSAAVISLRTALKPITGAYAAAGRMYLPGIPQSGQISGFLQAGFQSAALTFANLLQAAFVADGTDYQWNVVSYNPGSKPRTIRAINPVTSISINNVVRSQRRREYGVGI